MKLPIFRSELFLATTKLTRIENIEKLHHKEQVDTDAFIVHSYES